MLILHFDYPSAAAAVAVLRLQALADEGADVVFSGIDVLGVDTAVPATLDQLDELERYRDRAAALGLQLSRPALRPATLPAHVVAEIADQQGRGASWRRVCLEAYWHDGADLGDIDLLAGLAADAGLEATSVRTIVADPSARVRARRRMLDARRRGVGGVPVLEVDGTLVPADLSDDDLWALAGR